MASTWDKNDTYFNENWFRDAVAKAIIFREVDKMVMSADWYQGGYKANIVTYSLAWLAEYLRTEKKSGINFSKVWKMQTMTPELRSCFEAITKAVSIKIQETPDTVKNVTEWCKKQACWNGVKSMKIDLPDEYLLSICKSNESIHQEEQDAQKVQKIDTEVSDEIRVFQLGDKWREIQDFAMAKNLLTPEQDLAITRMLKGRVPTTVQTKHLIKVLLRVKDEGFEL